MRFRYKNTPRPQGSAPLADATPPTFAADKPAEKADKRAALLQLQNPYGRRFSSDNTFDALVANKNKKE